MILYSYVFYLLFNGFIVFFRFLQGYGIVRGKLHLFLVNFAYKKREAAAVVLRPISGVAISMRLIMALILYGQKEKRITPDPSSPRKDKKTKKLKTITAYMEIILFPGSKKENPELNPGCT